MKKFQGLLYSKPPLRPYARLYGVLGSVFVSSKIQNRSELWYFWYAQSGYYSNEIEFCGFFVVRETASVTGSPSAALTRRPLCFSREHIRCAFRQRDIGSPVFALPVQLLERLHAPSGHELNRDQRSFTNETTSGKTVTAVKYTKRPLPPTRFPLLPKPLLLPLPLLPSLNMALRRSATTGDG